MTCTHCHTTDLLLANLTAVGEELVCPLCLSSWHAYEYTHQVLVRPAPAPEHGLVVEDIPRGNAGRIAAMERRRRSA